MKARWLLHIFFWLSYLLFESYIEFAWISASFAAIPVPKRWMMAMEGEMVLLLIKIPLTYFIIHLINNLAGRIRQPLITFSLGVAAFAIGTILHRLAILKWVLPYIYDEKGSTEMLFAVQRIISALLNLLFIVGVSVAIKQYRLFQLSKENGKSLLKEKLEAELRFLRTQTNPHFLFNTLNNIYALARKKADETPEVVMKLSKLLRFMLYESRNNSIAIADELRVLTDYIELEKIRYNERLSIRFSKVLDDELQPIAPLILLPFVENAFKHGASETRFNSYIHIDVHLEKGWLIFMIENSKDEEIEKEIVESIGLSNVRRQLELMYPEHTLEMENGKNLFKVLLTINLLHHAAISMHHR